MAKRDMPDSEEESTLDRSSTPIFLVAPLEADAPESHPVIKTISNDQTENKNFLHHMPTL